MANYLIRGIQREAATPPVQAVTITQSKRLLPGTAREGGALAIEAAPEEVVRVELENGFVLWTRADDLLRERGRKEVRRDGVEAWEVDTRPPSPARGGTRGWLGLGIKTLDFFGIDLAAKTARELAEALENRLLAGRTPGLYRCSWSAPLCLTEVPADEALPADQGALLVFLHGTASSGAGSFGRLWEDNNAAGKAARETFLAKYGERAFAWEHRSLTLSPVANALALARRLPAGAEVHLVSHSRGGLVGELLCLGERFGAQDPLQGSWLQDLFAADRILAEQLGLSLLRPEAARQRDADYRQDRELLDQFLAVLKDKQFKIRRFVRVACPARGTTLASGRLDRWLSVLNYLTGNGLAGDVADFLLAVVKERTDPRTLPGLEAMMPGSALTRLLQHPELRTQADLSVIAGDIEGDSVWSQLKLLAADWFYGGDHDLIVNTGSMYGGLRRPEGGARFLFDQGPDVHHFHYFKNDRSVRWLVAGLTRDDATHGGFQPLEPAKAETPRWREAVRRSREVATPRPLAVVLPGTMGSALTVGGSGIWLNYWALLRGGLRRLRMGAVGVEPTELLDQFYGPLVEFLARSHRIEVFPYDWRLSVREAAERLADRLGEWLPAVERQNQPVHLVGHSMGGLVVRAMIADGGRGAALWQRIIRLPRSRFLMLGTPNLGSYEAVRWLTGHNPTQAKLSLLDITQSTNEIVNLVREFPGLLELLPFDPSKPDFSEQSLWQNLKHELSAGWDPAPVAALAQARETWNLLRQAAADPQRMIYVAGCQKATVASYEVKPYSEAWLATLNRLDFGFTPEGDGTVPWASGRLPGVETWYVEDTAHDQLCAQKRAFPAFLDLLMSGATSRLANVPPAQSREAETDGRRGAPPQAPPWDTLPDEGDLRSFTFGPAGPIEERAAEAGVPTIQVSIRHGNLAYAKHPVLVGHYLGDGLYSAEKALDERLHRALSARHRLGLYPGPIGSHAVFIDRSRATQPGGAVVMGLGQMGDLTPGSLTAGVREAWLEYALAVAEWPDDRFGPACSPRSASLTCLLVGSSAGGVTMRDSVEAILRGAVAANARLVESELEGRVIIDRIEFLEAYEDVAIAAAQALEQILADGPLALEVSWADPVIEDGEGKLHSVQRDEAAGWWHQLEIVEDRQQERLRFVATTNRARAEESLATGQLSLADAFIRQASQTATADLETARTLFEMLVPNRLKELAPRRADLVLLVDEFTARYPWELLADRWSQDGRPPAVAARVVRQFRTSTFRSYPAHASEVTALVVGNPNLDGWELFSDLPGARREAQAVLALLRAHGVRSLDCVDRPASFILEGLHKEPWRILHLAGHGEHEFSIEDFVKPSPTAVPSGCPAASPTRRVSGMVIGKETFLTSGDVEQMRWVPELVFVNCCHLGKTLAAREPSHGLLAANLAAQFIAMGVKAVLAAGWAVDDAAAAAFAETFYKRLLGGEAFAEAVRAAREDIWARFPGVNTWGAYQCYGDPNYRLYRAGAGAGTRSAQTFRTPAEAIVAFRNLTETIRMQPHDAAGSAEKLAGWRREIQRTLAAIPRAQREHWLRRAPVAAAVGLAWGEICAWAEAIEALNQALQANQGDCPMSALEQRANFRARLCVQRWQETRNRGGAAAVAAASPQWIEEIDSVIAELLVLCRQFPNAERWGLLGGAYKRLAWLETEERRRMALTQMADAHERAFEAAGKSDPYHFSHWAIARLLARPAGDPPARPGAELETQCLGIIAAARERNEQRPNFWDAAGEANCALVGLLHRGDIAPAEARQEAERIAHLLLSAAERGVSPREYASVREHIDFVLALSDPLPQALRDALAVLRSLI